MATAQVNSKPLLILVGVSLPDAAPYIDPVTGIALPEETFMRFFMARVFDDQWVQRGYYGYVSWQDTAAVGISGTTPEQATIQVKPDSLFVKFHCALVTLTDLCHITLAAIRDAQGAITGWKVSRKVTNAFGTVEKVFPDVVFPPSAVQYTP